jgi:hypothetical protein
MHVMNICEVNRGREHRVVSERAKLTYLHARHPEKELESFWQKERFIMVLEELLMISMVITTY